MSILLAAIAITGWRLSRKAPPVAPDAAIYPIKGIDISAHNGPVDFDALTGDSIDFVLLKASEGTAFKDANFHANYRLARRAGMTVGAYHFFRFDASGYMQALNFLHSVRGKQLDLPLVIDIEEWTNPDDRTTLAIIKQLRQLIEMLEQAGYNVMLYSNKDGYNRFIRGNFDRYPLWIASLTDTPTGNWQLWQYTHRGAVKGIDSRVDINTFNGSRSSWLDWLDEIRGQ